MRLARKETQDIMMTPLPEGILLVDKATGKTSFSLVNILRRRLSVRKIGHAGTLDPLATGLMVMLIGSRFTKISESLLTNDKEYEAEIFLGSSTDTYDSEGKILFQSEIIPTREEIETALHTFQGIIQQVPPMFSAKKVNGKKLYELARQGKTIERKAVSVEVKTTLLSYHYPLVSLNVSCSKGTYIRSIAHELGVLLGSGAHLSNLRRTRSGQFHVQDSIPESYLQSPEVDLRPYLFSL